MTRVLKLIGRYLAKNGCRIDKYWLKGGELLIVRKHCPKCGKKMDGFELDWNWNSCYECGTKAVSDRRCEDVNHNAGSGAAGGYEDCLGGRSAGGDGQGPSQGAGV